MPQSLFRDAARAGIYYLPESRRPAIAPAGLQPVEVELRHPEDHEAMLRQLGEALGFPGWYGANFDALHDCLTDPDWQPGVAGHLLILAGLGACLAAAPEDASILLDVFRSAIEVRREAGRPLWVLLDAPAPGIPELPAA